MSDEESRAAERTLARRGIGVNSSYEDMVWQDRHVAMELAIRLLEAKPFPEREADDSDWEFQSTMDKHGEIIAKAAWSAVNGVTRLAKGEIESENKRIKWAAEAAAKAAEERKAEEEAALLVVTQGETS